MAIASLRRDGEALAAPLPPLAVEAERIAAAVALGVHGRRRPGVGETFWEYRRHRHEDGAQRIDWRRSARTEHLFVRENEHEAAQSVCLWRDGRAGMALTPVRGRPSKRDRAAVLLIALASLLTRGGERVAVPGESRAARSGRTGFSRVARRLTDGAGDPEALSPLNTPRFAHVVAASDFYDPLEEWRDRLAPLAGRGARGAVVQVIDPEEADFPFEGRTVFTPPGGGAETTFGRAQAVRHAYRSRFRAHREGLEALARALGWAFVTSRTDEPAAPALLALYAGFAPQRGG